MAFFAGVNSIGLTMGHDNNIGDPVELALPQICDSSESEDGKLASRLLNLTKGKPLKRDAKDWTTDSDLDQQQQSSLHSTSFSSSPFHHIPTIATLPPSQQIKVVSKSLEALPSGSLRGSQRNPGIKAAKHRFLLEKVAKQQEAKNVSEVVEVGHQESEMSTQSAIPPQNRSGASASSSTMSLVSQTSAPEKAAPRPMVLLSPQSLYTQNPTSFTSGTNGSYDLSSPHGRPDTAFQHPLPKLPNHSSYLSSAITDRNDTVQNGWTTREHLYIKVYGLPKSTTTRDLWTAFKNEGHIAYIQIYENENAKGYRDRKASVKFRYALDLSP